MTPVVRSLVVPILAASVLPACGALAQSAKKPAPELPVSQGSPSQSWNLSIAPGPKGETNAAIMHTADFDRSDPLLAGLMLRCASQGLDVIVVTLLPFPPKTHPQVILQNTIQTFNLQGSVIPTGAGVLVPIAGEELAHGSWQQNPDLSVKILDGETAIQGVIKLAGLPEAANHLESQCSKNEMK